MSLDVGLCVLASVVLYILYYANWQQNNKIKDTQDTYILKLSTQAYMSIKHNTNRTHRTMVKEKE